MAIKRTTAAQPSASPQRQRGVVLIIALVMLITITFAGIALFRQIGLGQVIIGNLAFKQAATNAADRGAEQARAWLTQPTLASIPRLQGNVADVVGYFPAACYTATNNWGVASTDSSCTLPTAPAFDPTTYTWTDATSILAAGPDTDPTTGVDSAGNTVRYVMHRMCNMDGAINEVREFPDGTQAIQSCALASGGRSCLDQGLQFAANCFSQPVQPYYRVTARVQGPRNTLSYVEVVLF